MSSDTFRAFPEPPRPRFRPISGPIQPAQTDCFDCPNTGVRRKPLRIPRVSVGVYFADTDSMHKERRATARFSKTSEDWAWVVMRRPQTALISAMCVCVLGVRALLISVFCCFGPFCGRGRPQDLSERVGLEICCRNQGLLPSGIGSEAIFGGGGPPLGSFLCHTKNGFCVPQWSLKST